MIKNRGNNTLDSIIDLFLKNEKLIKEIKKLLKLKKDLNAFTTIPVEVSHHCSYTSEDIFMQLFSTRILAQSSLNLYYNYSFYRKYSFTKIISDICITEPYADYDSIPDVNKVIFTIVRYIVIFQILYKRESKKYVGICEYCDTEIEESDVQCSICDMNVPNKNFKENSSPDENEKLQAIMKYDSTDFLKCNDGFAQSSNNNWKCPLCTFINTLSNKDCGACGHVNELKKVKNFNNINCHSSGSKVYQTTWKCTFCHESNLEHTFICQYCRKKADFFHMWRCERCSCFNEDCDHLCKACNNENKNRDFSKNIKDDEDATHRIEKVSSKDLEDEWMIIEVSEGDSSEKDGEKRIVSVTSSMSLKVLFVGNINEIKK